MKNDLIWGHNKDHFSPFVHVCCDVFAIETGSQGGTNTSSDPLAANDANYLLKEIILSTTGELGDQC